MRHDLHVLGARMCLRECTTHSPTCRASRNALEDPWDEPNEGMFTRSVSPESAPDQPTYIEIDYERGDPVAIDGRRLSPATLLTNLNKVAGENGEPPDAPPSPVPSLPCCPYGTCRISLAGGGRTAAWRWQRRHAAHSSCTT